MSNSADLRAVTYFDPHAGLVVQGEFHEYGYTNQYQAAPIEGLSLILRFRESPTHQYTKSFPIHNEMLLYTYSNYQRDVSYTSATPDQQLFTSCRSPQDCRATGVVGFHGLFMQFMGEHSNGLIFGLDQWPPPTTQEGTANTDLKVWYEDQPDVVWSPVEDPWQLLVDNGEWTRVEVNMPTRPEYLYVQWERPDGKTLLWKTMGMVRETSLLQQRLGLAINPPLGSHKSSRSNLLGALDGHRRPTCSVPRPGEHLWGRTRAHHPGHDRLGNNRGLPVTLSTMPSA